MNESLRNYDVVGEASKVVEGERRLHLLRRMISILNGEESRLMPRDKEFMGWFLKQIDKRDAES